MAARTAAAPVTLVANSRAAGRTGVLAAARHGGSPHLPPDRRRRWEAAPRRLPTDGSNVAPADTSSGGRQRAPRAADRRPQLIGYERAEAAARRAACHYVGRPSRRVVPGGHLRRGASPPSPSRRDRRAPPPARFTAARWSLQSAVTVRQALLCMAAVSAGRLRRSAGPPGLPLDHGDRVGVAPSSARPRPCRRGHAPASAVDIGTP